MSPGQQVEIRAALACGGTGGHLFPGLAVAEELRRRGCAVTLLVSPKEVDQQAVRNVRGMEVVTLPAVGLTRGRAGAFLAGFIKSFLAARRAFKPHPPQAVLAMGGFTSAPPVLAGKFLGAKTFLHESNTIPGRANRWLAKIADRAFVGFHGTAEVLPRGKAQVTGTPVRPQFQPGRQAECRKALNLAPERPVVLVMGGSQGASGINDLVLQALPCLGELAHQWQWLHLSGRADFEKVTEGYRGLNIKATTLAFFDQMELALGAATAAVSRAGASSLAEIAAMRLPSLLVPYPAATDDHQFHNARALEATGAAKLMVQKGATRDVLAGLLRELVMDQAVRESMQRSLISWHRPRAAEEISQAILALVTGTNTLPKERQATDGNQESDTGAEVSSVLARTRRITPREALA